MKAFSRPIACTLMPSNSCSRGMLRNASGKHSFSGLLAWGTPSTIKGMINSVRPSSMNVATSLLTHEELAQLGEQITIRNFDCSNSLCNCSERTPLVKSVLSLNTGRIYLGMLNDSLRITEGSL